MKLESEMPLVGACACPGTMWDNIKSNYIFEVKYFNYIFRFCLEFLVFRRHKLDTIEFYLSSITT